MDESGGGDGGRKWQANHKGEDVPAQSSVNSQPGSEPSGASLTGGLSAPLHPLYMTEILELIFQHVVAQPRPSDAAKDVQSVRLVSKTWKDAMTRVYRRKRPPTYIGPVLTSEPLNLIQSSADLARFLDVMKDSTMIPVESFCITLNLYYPWLREWVLKLLIVCGPQIVSLHFDCEDFEVATIYGPQGIIDLQQNISQLSLPKLKRLFFCCFSEHVAPQLKLTLMFVVENLILAMLTAARNLIECHFPIVSFHDPESPEADRVTQFLDAFIARLPQTIKSLQISLSTGDTTRHTFQKLAETGVKLTTFEFTSCSAVHKAELCSFLEKQSDTLTDLAFFSDEFGKLPLSPPPVFPRMEKLTKLTICNMGPERCSFVDKFPNVIFLDLKCWGDSNSFSGLLACVEKNRDKAPSVKELYLPYGFDMAPHIRRISRCFPKTSKLILDTTRDIKDTLAEVFTYFTDVEHLEITFRFKRNYNADAMLSGVSKADWKWINEDGNFQGLTSLEQLQRRPSILNLTKLRTLAVKKTPLGLHFDRIVLSDFAAHFLFLRMEELKELTLHGSQLSSEYRERLQCKVRLSIVEDWRKDREDDDNDDPNYDSSDEEEQAGGAN